MNIWAIINNKNFSKLNFGLTPIAALSKVCPNVTQLLLMFQKIFGDIVTKQTNIEKRYNFLYGMNEQHGSFKRMFKEIKRILWRNK